MTLVWRKCRGLWAVKMGLTILHQNTQPEKHIIKADLPPSCPPLCPNLA